MAEESQSRETGMSLQEQYEATDRSDLWPKAALKTSLWLEAHPLHFSGHGFSLRVKKLALEAIVTEALEGANGKSVADVDLDEYLNVYIEDHHSQAIERAQEITREMQARYESAAEE